MKSLLQTSFDDVNSKICQLNEMKGEEEGEGNENENENENEMNIVSVKREWDGVNINAKRISNNNNAKSPNTDQFQSHSNSNSNSFSIIHNPKSFVQVLSTTTHSFFEKYIIPEMMRNDDDDDNSDNKYDEIQYPGMTIYSLLLLLTKNKSAVFIQLIDLTKNTIGFDDGVIECDNYQIQYCENAIEHCEYELTEHRFIIADVLTKKMSILISPFLDSFFIEYDISAMKENVIIDLNEEGRRWEGGELNGKPFGFGCEYSEEGNLVYEGFVFEGKKVCFGKEWNDDGNNNCLMYEGGYCNDERCGKVFSMI